MWNLKKSNSKKQPVTAMGYLRVREVGEKRWLNSRNLMDSMGIMVNNTVLCP